jgi:Fic family protein
MADWDLDNPLLAENLQKLLREIRDKALRRERLNLAAIRSWHLAMMEGLDVPPGAAVGVFRGEPLLKRCEVRIGIHRGTQPGQVANELAEFESTMERVLNKLDVSVAPNELPDEDGLLAVIETCAWAHSEWARIHPFANGNGRTARLLANAIAMRYGLPPFVRLRPRPGDPYGMVADASMGGNWAPTVVLFHEMLDECLK